MKLSDAVREIASGDPYWQSGSKRVQATALLRQIAHEHDALRAENKALRAAFASLRDRLTEVSVQAEDAVIAINMEAVSTPHDPFDDLVASGGLPEAQALADLPQQGCDHTYVTATDYPPGTRVTRCIKCGQIE